MIVLFLAIVLPPRIAFVDKESTAWVVLNWIINASFAIDIILTFFTAKEDPKLQVLITDKRRIAKIYVKSWFVIDIISIIPFESILQS